MKKLAKQYCVLEFTFSTKPPRLGLIQSIGKPYDDHFKDNQFEHVLFQF
jgi:hypothetical protein